MKKLTKLTALALVAVMLLLAFAACGGKKEAVTADAFKTAAEAAGMTVEAGNEGDDSQYTSMMAKHPDGWTVQFLQFDTLAHAQEYFPVIKKFIEDQKTGTGSSQTTSKDAYAFYSQTNGGMFAYTSRINDTFVYVAPAAEAYKDAIKAFIDSIGY